MTSDHLRYYRCQGKTPINVQCRLISNMTLVHSSVGSVQYLTLWIDSSSEIEPHAGEMCSANVSILDLLSFLAPCTV